MSTTTWDVRVDVPARDLDDDAAAELLEQLHGLRPGIVVGEALLGITLVLEEATLRQAIATGLQQVEAATGDKAVGVSARTREETERLLARPAIPELVGYAEIADMLGVSRQRARQLADAAGFPPAAVTTAAGPLRVRAAVEAWASNWRRQGGRPPKESTD